jgi:hypothetical protein
MKKEAIIEEARDYSQRTVITSLEMPMLQRT